MPYTYFTEKLLGLQDLIITNIKEADRILKIFAKLEVKEQHCPCCGTTTRTIHDYRKQVIKDIQIAGRSVEIHFRKRKYRCHIVVKDLYAISMTFSDYNILLGKIQFIITLKVQTIS